MTVPPDTEQSPLALPSLLTAERQPRTLALPAATVALAAQVLLAMLVAVAGPITINPYRPVPEPEVPEPRRSVPLVAPLVLTQKQPNKGKLTENVTLESLVAPRQEQALSSPAAPAPPRKVMVPQRASAPAPPAPVNLPTPPKLEVAENRQPPSGNPLLGNAPQGLPAAPPPPAEQKPKLAFETPGAASGTEAGRTLGLGRLAPPRTSVEEAVRSVARGGGGGLVVGDVMDGGGLGLPSATPSQGRTGSQLELMSDPQGVDFKPYLIRVLSAVRRNWFAVIPESARLGRRGRVMVQFIIDKNGRVPKLVISSASGADALDRAAVAGISASNPFPPLPTEFPGDQIRLQLSFLYNLP